MSPLKPTLIICFGDIGTGKSTTAKILAIDLNMALFSFDDLAPEVTKKNKIFGDDGSFLLSPDEIQKVYNTMHERAQKSLRSGIHVILESMYFSEQRRQAVACGKDVGARVILIEFTANAQAIDRRINNRYQKNNQTPNITLSHLWRGRLGSEPRADLAVDTTNQSPQEASALIISHLSS